MIPAYNAAGSLGGAIESVLAQDEGGWEIVVVDDGSTDGTAAVVERYASVDARIRLLRQENAGPAAARNRGVEAARGRFICRLDADDAYESSFVRVIRSAIERHPGFQVYSAMGWRSYGPGQRVPTHDGAGWTQEREITRLEMLAHNHVFGMCAYERDAALRVGGSRPGVYVEDYDLWLRMLLDGARFWFVPEAIGVYEVAATAMSSDRVVMARAVEDVLRRVIDEGVLAGRELRVAQAALRRSGATIARAELEERLRSGRYTGARRAYIVAMPAYRHPVRRMLGLLLIMVSPRLFDRIAAQRPAR
ncbi:MAG TPA: glycosyltransferase family 2 protein [Coriobacteriia bacterium]